LTESPFGETNPRLPRLCFQLVEDYIPMKTKLLLSILVLPFVGCVTRTVYVERPGATPSAEVVTAPPTASAEVVVQEPPPPLRTEVIVEPPGPGYVWTPGYWSWQGRWVWIGGRYVVRPHPHAVWVTGRWVRRGHGHVWVAGRWR
jgi:hypothetical protein